ncbi:MAG: alpha/beta hydrolase [Selenomonadaceae bacterium]|nr:alpha/beta hydrolase [Selenomonadaceae bacterium]
MKKFLKRVLACSFILCMTGSAGVSAQIPAEVQNNAQHVQFVQQHNGLKIAGNLYLPSNYKPGKKYPAIITVHPGGGVKEQTSGLYAMLLAKKGFVTLAFDASHQGESEGQPRYIEIPTERVEDIRSAVDYLTTLPQVDANKIGVLGICAGGGYSISAAQTEHRIKALATVSAVDVGNIARQGWDGKSGSVEAQIKALEVIAAQRTAEANGAPVRYDHIVPTKDEITAYTPRDIVEASEYYTEARGQHPNARNMSMFSAADAVYTFHAFSDMETLLTQPALFIAGTEAGSLWQSEIAYNKATAAASREFYKIDGATHMDLYDVTKFVNQVVDKLEKFFHTNLGK